MPLDMAVNVRKSSCTRIGRLDHDSVLNVAVLPL